MPQTSDSKIRIALLFRSYGPYHLARLNYLRRRASVLAIEFSDIDSEYDWQTTDAKQSAGIISLSKGNHGRVRSLEILDGWIKKFSPDVVAIPGYSEPLALVAANLCQGLAIPTVLMSDSHNLIGRRNPVREALKRRALSLFNSAFVAGAPQKDYLSGLGFPVSRISLGYDVVDNQHFALERSSALADPPSVHGDRLIQPRFLCCSRLVEGKNLIALIDAFRRYQDQTANRGWHLALAGDGPLYGAISRRIAELSLAEHVYLVGRTAYKNLPALYASASAFVFPSLSETWGLVINEAMAAGLPVLVSDRVGCHPDLVQDGINGHIFDPHDTAQLAKLLHVIATTPRRQDMGDASRRIIRDWDLDRFSSGMIEAAANAYSFRSQRKSSAAIAVAAVLSYRAHRAAADHRRPMQAE